MLKGIHTIRYTLTDECGNPTICDFDIEVVDLTPPVAVTKQNLVVGLTNDGFGNEGTAKLFAKDLDNGSYDNCTDVRFQIRRDGDPDNWSCGYVGNDTYAEGLIYPNHPDDLDQGEYIKLCCDDLLADIDEDGVADGIVKVWFRVWDDANFNGIYGDEFDNFNESWIHVRVETKLPPILQVPPMGILECSDDPTDPAVIDAMGGPALAFDICDAATVEYTDECDADLNGNGSTNERVEVAPGVFVNEKFNKDCNYGPIERTWCITGTNICNTQIIILKEPANLFNGCADTGRADEGAILWPYEN